MIRNGVEIAASFAEAFPMRATRLIVTAETPRWASIAGETMTGFATSVIACGAEAGIEGEMAQGETPDGRPGVSVLVFAMASDALQDQLIRRVGQCVLTSPGSACFDGLAEARDGRLKLGSQLRYFGDGWQISKRLGRRRFWRVPTMDGEFLCEASSGLTKGAVGGGNILIVGRERAACLAAAEDAADAVAGVPGAIAPFPGGVARSGSKVGSKYKSLFASTNEAWAPLLKGQVESELRDGEEAVYEIVIDGLTAEAVARAMGAAAEAVIARGSAAGITRISAGNYGGKLGPHHFHLREVIR